MAKNESEEQKRSRNAVEGKRGTYYQLNPKADLVVIGWDTKHRSRAEHPLFQDRALLPVNQFLVKSIKAKNVRQNVIARKNGTRPDGTPILEVIAGRQRTKAARVANEELIAEGEAPWLIPVFVVQEDDSSAQELTEIENSQRVDEDPINRAKGMKYHLDKGKDEEYVANVIFGCDVQTMKRTMALLDLDDEVVNAVRDKRMSAHAAYEMRNQSRENQREILNSLLGTPAAQAVDPAAASDALSASVTLTAEEPKAKRKSPTAADVRQKVAEKNGEVKYEKLSRVTINRLLTEYDKPNSAIKSYITLETIYVIRAIAGKGSVEKVAGLKAVLDYIDEKFAKRPKGEATVVTVDQSEDEDSDEEETEEKPAKAKTGRKTKRRGK